MKKIILLLTITACLLSACQKSKGTYYKPQQQKSIITEEGKERALAKKRTELNVTTSMFNNSTKLTILVPAIQGDITNNVAELIQMKMLQLASGNGICGIGGDPSFVLAGVMTPIDRSVTSTIPTKISISYDFTLYVANILAGDIYSSYNMKLVGIGASNEKATINAVNAIKNSVELNQFLESANKKIIDYYEKDPQSVVARAEILESQNKYNLAYLLLSSVPIDATKTYQLVQTKIPDLQKKYFIQRCEQTIADFKDAIMRAGSDYNEDITAYYKMIPENSLYKKEADKLYNEYMGQLSKSIKEKIAHQYYIEKESLAYKKLEMQLNIQANEELMQLYRQQISQQKPIQETADFSISGLLMQVAQIGGSQFMNLLL